MQSKPIAISLGVVLVASMLGIFYFFVPFDLGRAQQAPVISSTPIPQAQAQDQGQAFILPVSQPNYLPIRDFNVADPTVQAKAAGLYNVKSAKFLYSKNIDDRLPIASITKLMTAVVILEKLGLEQTVTVAAQDVNVDGHGADLTRNERITAKELLRIMLIKSSNDAASTFATFAKEQGIDLVGEMNSKATALGMADTRFLDPSGLNDTGYSSVRDLVRLLSYVGQKHPLIWEVLRTKSDSVYSADGAIAHPVTNTNQLLDIIPRIVGGKTGYTDAAMGTMALAVSRPDGDTLMSIVLGSTDRFGDTRRLIEWSKTAYIWE